MATAGDTDMGTVGHMEMDTGAATEMAPVTVAATVTEVAMVTDHGTANAPSLFSLPTRRTHRVRRVFYELLRPGLAGRVSDPSA